MFTHSINCSHCGLEITENWIQYVVSSEIIDEERGSIPKEPIMTTNYILL